MLVYLPSALSHTPLDVIHSTVYHRVSRWMDKLHSGHCPIDEASKYERCEVWSGSRRFHFFLDPNDNIIPQPFRRGAFWEAWMHGHFRRYANTSATAVDVGANVGAHTVMLSTLFGEVHAFEMQRGVQRMLRKNVASNSAPGRVHLHHFALGATDGSNGHYCDLPGRYRNRGGMAASQGRGPRKKGCQQIHFRTLDSVLGQLDRPLALMKVDVEGFEESVLLGSRRLIARHRPVIFFESFALSQKQNLTRMLAELDYDTHVLNYPHDYIALPRRAR